MEDEDGLLDVEPSAETSYTGRALFALLVILGGTIFLIYRAYPAHHPIRANPNFIDDIFANNLVIFAARLVLFSVALVLTASCAFLIVSIAQRWKAGHWVNRFWIFETQAVEDLSGQVETWQNLWFEANQENEQLRARVEQTDALLAELLGNGEDDEELSMDEEEPEDQDET